MKKTAIAILCTFLMLSLLLCGCTKEEKVSDGNVADTDYSLDASYYDDDIAQVNLLIEGCFYLKGTMTDDTGESNVVEMAMKDGNSFMGSQMDGVTMGFMTVDGSYYMVYPDGQSVLLLDEGICETMGLDPAEMKVDPSQLNFGELHEEDLVSTEDALVDASMATCRTYRQATGGFIKTYVKDGLVVRLQVENADGTVKSVMDVDILSNNVPADKVSLPSGYKLYSGTTGMMTFMMKLASAMNVDLSE